MDLSEITKLCGYVIYVVLFLIALWGAYCVVMVWARVKQKRFRNEEVQVAFLQTVEERLEKGDFDRVAEICEGDERAMCQLVHLAVTNRQIGFEKVEQMAVDRFQRDVMADLGHRLSWVNTVIKSAPMVGLLGTVIGMMGAFNTLGSQKNVQADVLAGDIYVALITTACGLAIAIPLVWSTNSINLRIQKMEDLVAAGMNQFMQEFHVALENDKGSTSSKGVSRRGEPAPTG